MMIPHNICIYLLIFLVTFYTIFKKFLYFEHFEALFHPTIYEIEMKYLGNRVRFNYNDRENWCHNESNKTERKYLSTLNLSSQ